MANEIEIMNMKNEVNTGSVDLDTDVLYINAQIAAGRKSSHEVARTLLKIRNEGLFTVCASTFSDFCSDFFKINKATGSKLCAVAERFLAPELGDTYADFSISKLMEMRGATSEQLAEIKPSMTVAEIRKILTPVKAIEDKSEDKSEETEDKSEENDNSSCDIETDFGSVEVTDKTITGKGFEITLNKDGSYKTAKTDSVDGMLALIKYLSAKSISDGTDYTQWNSLFTTTLKF